MLSINGKTYSDATNEIARQLCQKLFPGAHEAIDGVVDAYCEKCEEITDEYLSPIWDHGRYTAEAAWRRATEEAAKDIAARLGPDLENRALGCMNDDNHHVTLKAGGAS
jgi:hypothetical protein